MVGQKKQILFFFQQNCICIAPFLTVALLYSKVVPVLNREPYTSLIPPQQVQALDCQVISNPVKESSNSGTSSSNVTDTLTATNGRTLSHSAHLAGNIGITTSQQMVTDEINLSAMLDLTALIVKNFKAEFCLLVY